MKRLFAVLIIVCMVFLMGCVGGTEESPTATPEPTVESDVVDIEQDITQNITELENSLSDIKGILD